MSRKLSTGSSITDLIGITPKCRLDGGNPSTWSFPEGTGQTFKAGEMVSLSGTTVVALAATVTDGSGQGVLGFAADPATGTVSTMRGVWVATPEMVFVGNVGHSTSASAQTAASDIGLRYGLTSLSSRTYVDKAKGTITSGNQLVRIIGLHEQDDHPCFYGRVYFTVLTNKCQLGILQMTNLSGSIDTIA